MVQQHDIESDTSIVDVINATSIIMIVNHNINQML
jgi:hypothetical protein